MSHRSIRPLLAVALAATLPLAGCTGAAEPLPGSSTPPAAPQLRLVAFDSCEQLLTDLRRATREAVGPYGLPGSSGRESALGGNGARTAVGEASAAGAPQAAAGSGPGSGDAFSGTNVHERGADEPDIVKSDGRRIVTVSDNTLRVVDAATRRQTGRLDLGVSTAGESRLLISGDAALVLVPGQQRLLPAIPGRLPVLPVANRSRVLLVDLKGPTVLSRFSGDGMLVDARQTGTTARVVLRSAPAIRFPALPTVVDDAARVAANRKSIDRAPVESWLPGFEVTTGDRTREGRVGCDKVSRPRNYSGTSLLSVLTFDLAKRALDDGDPVAVAADGDTVYGNGTSLYIANDQHWRGWRGGTTSGEQATEIYRFDTTGPGRPRYAAAGSVPGWLLNQYALSEFDGHLRVATTSEASAAQTRRGPAGPARRAPAEPAPLDPAGPGPGMPVTGGPAARAPQALERASTPPASALPASAPPASAPPASAPPVSAPPVSAPPGRDGAVTDGPADSSSSIHILRQNGDALVATGAVHGLGKGERIYSVRFVGPRGYVVTFRQTDPLYSVDLSDPARPEVTGELKITGYSAHLQPVGDNRLVGIGQEATTEGRTEGTQVSLFDVTDPRQPRRLAQHHVAGGQSEAEHDPHALLWWPAAGLLVVPLTVFDTRPGVAEPESTARALRVTADGLTQVGAVAHPSSKNSPTPTIRRSLVVGEVLWTLSDAGLQASNLTDLKPLGWVPAA